jgi:hypothetical protein
MEGLTNEEEDMIFETKPKLFSRTPNSLKDSNVSLSERQRKREESGHAPQLTTL